MPTKWYNILPDLPGPLLLPEPRTGNQLHLRSFPAFSYGADNAGIKPERYIEIPEELQVIYRTWRPTVYTGL